MAKDTVGKPFQSGEDPRRNVEGANKGSKWKKSLLRDIMSIPLEGDDLENFQEIEEKFPKVFNSDHERNFQLYMELKQISLVFSKNGMVAQRAIDAIKDRIDGKPKQTVSFTEADIQPTRFVVVQPKKETEAPKTTTRKRVRK